MNNKGFTLVEVLATIVIVAIISGIATITYTSFVKKSRDRVFSSYEDTMHAEASYYFFLDTSRLPRDTETKRVSLSDLQIEAIKNPLNSNDLCTNSYVDVTRNDVNGVISLTYNVCLKCSSGYDNCRIYEN